MDSRKCTYMCFVFCWGAVCVLMGMEGHKAESSARSPALEDCLGVSLDEGVGGGFKIISDNVWGLFLSSFFNPSLSNIMHKTRLSVDGDKPCSSIALPRKVHSPFLILVIICKSEKGVKLLKQI